MLIDYRKGYGYGIPLRLCNGILSGESVLNRYLVTVLNLAGLGFRFWLGLVTGLLAGYAILAQLGSR